MKQYSIYIINNTVNNKIYIGKTSNLKRRWNEHISKFQKTMPISKAIFKYGKDAFNINEFLTFSCEEDAFIYEKICISQAKNFGIELYNLTDGGEGPSGRKVSDHTKKIMSDKMTGSNNPNYGKNFTGTNSPLYGKSRSDQDKETFSKINKQIAISIREDYGSGKYSQKELAVKYNLSSQHVYRIVNNKVWK